jgi:hypothetical protein
LVTGGEGVGKSTIMSALLPHTSNGAKIDAEDVGQVNPFTFDQPFLDLLWNNVTAVIMNYWAAGYPTVIAGSLLEGDTHASFRQFRRRLPNDIGVYVVHLTASRQVRDERRIHRAKLSTKEWRERVDASYPTNDTSLRDNAGEYRYIPIDNSMQSSAETVAAIMRAIPEIYGSTRAPQLVVHQELTSRLVGHSSPGPLRADRAS